MCPDKHPHKKNNKIKKNCSAVRIYCIIPTGTTNTIQTTSLTSINEILMQLPWSNAMVLCMASQKRPRTCILEWLHLSKVNECLLLVAQRRQNWKGNGDTLLRFSLSKLFFFLALFSGPASPDSTSHEYYHSYTNIMLNTYMLKSYSIPFTQLISLLWEGTETERTGTNNQYSQKYPVNQYSAWNQNQPERWKSLMKLSGSNLKIQQNILFWHMPIKKQSLNRRWQRPECN